MIEQSRLSNLLLPPIVDVIGTLTCYTLVVVLLLLRLRLRLRLRLLLVVLLLVVLLLLVLVVVLLLLLLLMLIKPVACVPAVITAAPSTEQVFC